MLPTFVVFDATYNRDRLRDDWARVVRQLDAPAYFHCFEWYESYVRTLERDPQSVFFVVAYRREEPVGVFPLRLARKQVAGVTVRALEIPHSPITLLGDFVFRVCDENAGLVRQLIEFLRRQKRLQWDVLRISNVLDGSAAMFSIKNDTPRRTIWYEEPGCHFVVCSDFRASSKLKNKLNRLNRIGRVEYVHVRDAQSMVSAVDEFIDVEASGWKASEGTAIRCRPRERAFYHDAAQGFAAAGAAQVSLLRVGGKCIAGSYMLKTGRTLYWLKHGFDEEFAKSSPGQLLFTELVDDCLGRGEVDGINFITNNEWHRIFSPQEIEKQTALVFRANPPGLVSYSALRSKNLLRGIGVKKLLKLGTVARDWFRGHTGKGARQ